MKRYDRIRIESSGERKMKKFLLAIGLGCIGAAAFALTSCGGPQQITVTFVQNNVEYPITIEQGSGLSPGQIPSLQPKTGYDVAWDGDVTGTFSESTTIKAVYTAKEYTVSYDLGYDLGQGSSLSSATTSVTFDAPYQEDLLSPQRYGYTFAGWEYEGEPLTTNVWKIAENVTLDAVWENNYFTVTFRQEGQEDVELMIENGDYLTSETAPVVPVLLQNRPGYTLSWDTDIADITQDTLVTTTATANTYFVFYVVDGGTMPVYEQQVIYNETYVLNAATPTDSDKKVFAYWLRDSARFSSTGTWTIVGDVTLTAKFVNRYCTITYLTGESTVSQTTQTVEYGQPYTLETATPTDVNNRAFAYWTRNGVKIESTGTWLYEWEETETLTAKLVNRYCTLTFVATASVGEYGEQTGTVADNITTMVVEYGQSYTLPTATPADSNQFSFVGWKCGNTRLENSGVWLYEFDTEEELVVRWIRNWTEPA